jgi:type IX secretion system PorP/SprF family membrane protein
MKKTCIWLLLTVLTVCAGYSQDDTPNLEIDVPAQNLLKYNRFLLNPTFSTVREDKSYINLYHRNENGKFDDANDLYFISYSGRMGDRTGFGLSLFQQQYGTFSNFGAMANYGYGVRLAEKSALSFGFNLLYYSSGFDASEANPGVLIDPRLSELEDGSFMSFQPGINLAVGAFDVGLYAENLFDYNFKTSESLTDFSDKTFSAHLQYTKNFENASGVLEKGRLMALTRARKKGEEDVTLSGSLLLDLPKIGWLQGGYDDYYGASAGVGFNLTKRLSLGYTIEKGLSNGRENLGPTHELSFAYSFEPNLTEDRVMLDEEQEDEINYAQQEFLDKDAEIAELKKNLQENNEIIAELIFRQDSIEQAREKDLERRFAQIMRFVNNGNGSNNKNGNNQTLADYNKKDRETAIKRNGGVVTSTQDNVSNAVIKKDKKPIGIKNKNNSIASNKKEVNTAVKDNTSLASNKAKNNTLANTTKKNDGFVKAKKKYEDAIDKQAVANNIKNSRVRNLAGVQGGYYIIANVYRGSYYLNKFVDGLNNQGIDAAYFKNPRNGMKYVYLKRFDSWQEALQSYKSNVGGTYSEDIWIMTVDNGQEDSRLVAKGTKNNNVLVANNQNNNNKNKNASIKKSEAVTEKEYNPSILQKNVITKKSSSSPKVADISNLTEDQIKNTYSKNASVKRKPAKKGAVVNISNLQEGYYIVANVFAVPSNATRFVSALKEKGLDADYFINPTNNYRYVYLRKHNSWNNALVSYYSNLDDSYHDDMWIMRINTTNSVL